MKLLFISKKFSERVFPGAELVFTSPFLLTREFISEDLPTLERPAKAISGSSLSGHPDFLNALFMKSAEVIFISALFWNQKRGFITRPVISFG